MRGLSPSFMQELKTGILIGFLNAVLEDDTLCLEIRANSINIYYRGGSMFKIGYDNGKYAVSFDANYLRKNTEVIRAISPYNHSEWIRNIPLLKTEIDGYLFHVKAGLEREHQQLVQRDNNSSSIAGDTDYYIADLEYSRPENKSRFDLLGIKWSSKASNHKVGKNLRLAIFEMKYGDGAITGSAGIKKHFIDLNRLMNDKAKYESICNDAEVMLNQKIELGIFVSPSTKHQMITVSRGKPEYILLIANHKPAKKALVRELRAVTNEDYYQDLKQLVDIRVARPSYLGYGLYEESMMNIEDIIDASPIVL